LYFYFPTTTDDTAYASCHLCFLINHPSRPSLPPSRPRNLERMRPILVCSAALLLPHYYYCGTSSCYDGRFEKELLKKSSILNVRVVNNTNIVFAKLFCKGLDSTSIQDRFWMRTDQNTAIQYSN
jgi:hypothetical protein